MQKQLKFSILSALGFLTLASCGPTISEIKPIEVITTEIKRSAPILPKVDQIKSRSVEWIVVTEDNIDETFAAIRGEKVLFAMTTKNYENLALNISDVRQLIQQQGVLIAAYKQQFDK